MIELKRQLKTSLNMFWFFREELKQLQNTNESEILMTNRILKNEVIDMADLAEKMFRLMV
jgi:hypothetical protein